MKTSVDKPNEEVQIQIIPLIDVIFCILTFFILASLQLTRQQAINVNVPKVAGGGAVAGQGSERPVISIDASGVASLNGRPLDRARLRLTVQEYYQKNPNGQMVLYADKNAFYDNVLQVFAVMQEVGGDRVSLGIMPESPAGAITSPTANPTLSPNSTLLNPTTNPTANPALTPFRYGNSNPYSPTNPVQVSPLPGQNPLNPSPASSGINPDPGSGTQRP